MPVSDDEFDEDGELHTDPFEPTVFFDDPESEEVPDPPGGGDRDPSSSASSASDADSASSSMIHAASSVPPRGSSNEDSRHHPRTELFVDPESSGRVLGDRFEVDRLLGEGGMGEVFLVRDRQIEDREVALKLVRSKWSANPKFRNLFFQEIRSAQEFVSPHVVQVRDCGQLSDGQLFFTMDHVAGESLSGLLRREKSLPPKHALEIIRQLLLGLSSGHERGLIHRDVKPGNVMLTARVPKTSENPFGVNVQLLDFGLAALTAKLGKGRGPGTPHYMSPEQVSGQRLDARSDLFAVGVLLFELVSGQRPFNGRTKDEITSSVIDTDPIPLIDNLDTIKKPIKKLLRRALQKEREKRFSSAADFIAAIERVGPLRDEDSAPKWVAGLAFVTTASTVVLGGMLAKERLESKVDAGFDRVAAESELRESKVEVNRVKGLLSAAESQRDDFQNRWNAEVKEADKFEASAKAFREQRDALQEQLDANSTSVIAAKQGEMSSQIAKNETTDQFSRINDSLILQVNALFERVAVTADQYGGRLADVGVAYDEFIEALLEGQHARQTLRMTALRRRFLGDGQKMGFDYLEEVEKLSRDVSRFGTRGDISGMSSFRELTKFENQLEDLRGEVLRGGFIGSVSSFPGPGIREAGRWLGMRAVDAEEMAAFIWQKATAGGLADYSEPSDSLRTFLGDGQGSGGPDPSGESELQDAEAASKRVVAAKTAIEEWLGRETRVSSIASTLYGAQRDADLQDQRIAKLDSVFSAIENRIEELKGELSADADEKLNAIFRADEFDRQVEGTVEFLRLYGIAGKEHVPNLCRAILDGATEIAIADGRLSATALQGLPASIEQLGDLVNEEPSPSGESVVKYGLGDEEPELLRDLNWLISARAWYLGLSIGKTVWQERFLKETVLKPTDTFAETPWRETFAFQYQLYSSSMALPRYAADGCASVYWIQDSSSRPLGWDVFRAGVGDQTSKVLSQRLAPNGVPRRRAPLEFDGVAFEGSKRLPWRNSEALRLDAVEALEFVSWTPPEEEVQEEFGRLQSTSSFANFQRNRTLAVLMDEVYKSHWSPDDGYRCARVVLGDRRSCLVHPILGIVQYKAAKETSDLVHVQSPPKNF